jgi:hypothetical protein
MQNRELFTDDDYEILRRLKKQCRTDLATLNNLKGFELDEFMNEW